MREICTSSARETENLGGGVRGRYIDGKCFTLLLAFSSNLKWLKLRTDLPHLKVQIFKLAAVI